MKKILLIEEDAHQASMLVDELSHEGFDVFHLTNEEDLLNDMDFFTLYPPDIILLGVNLKGKLDGFEISRRIRERSRIPIIFQTDCIQINDLQKGFQIGNVDYLKKPYSIQELILRVYEMLYRNQPPPTLQEKRVITKSYHIGNYFFLPTELSLQFRDVKIHLPKNESEVLKLLCENEGKVMTKNEILDFVWNEKDLKQKEPSLHNILYSLRSKLSNDEHVEIRTIPKVGYLLAIT